MPVLLQLCQTSSFALSFAARHRHVAFGLRGRWNCGIPAGEYSKGYPGQRQGKSEHRTKINEPSFAGITANRETKAGVFGANGAFLFHYWSLGLVERIVEELRHCPPRFVRGGCIEFKRPQNVGNSVLAVRPNPVKLFQCRPVNYLLRRQSHAE